MSDQASTRVGWARLAVGLAQGLVLYGLLWSTGVRDAFSPLGHADPVWPATVHWLYAALTLAALTGPVILVGGLGTLHRVTLASWTLVGAAVAACLAAYDVLRSVASPTPMAPGFQVFVAIGAFLFIAHNLLAVRDAEGRWIAPYPLRFDSAWKQGVQLALSLAFVGAFWAVMGLGVALFGLIGLTGFADLLKHPWFDIPVSTMVFAGAVHLTDVRGGLIKGIRTVALTMLAWLMPLMGLIAAAFLVALPFTGLAPLWKVSHSTGVLLTAIAGLVLLLNAAYQDGEAESRAPLILRWCGRITALTLAPLAAIAAYGLWLRLGQYGLTPERIVVAACLSIAAIYALGYAVAAVEPSAWLRRLEPTNVAAAYVILATILALFTPIADPGRIAVADQVARLNAGKTAPEKFDFAFLRFKAGTYGRDALKVLAARTSGPNAAAIAERAKAAQAMTSPWMATIPPPQPPATIDSFAVYPTGRRLPPDFLKTRLADPSGQPLNCPQRGDCEAYILTPDPQGEPVVVVSENPFSLLIFTHAKAGGWEVAGRIEADACQSLENANADRAALRAGQVRAIPHLGYDVEIAGRRRVVDPASDCAAKPAPNGRPPVGPPVPPTPR